MSQAAVRISVIIPAAGSGERFFKDKRAERGSSKICAELGGKPMIARSLEAFAASPLVREIVIAVRPGMEARLRRLISTRVKKPVRIVPGGKTRAESVWKALARVSPSSSYVCIHDAARPCVKTEWLERLADKLNGADGIVLGRPVVSTIKTFDPGSGHVLTTPDRKRLFEAETPQLLRKELLLRAYQKFGTSAFQASDDSSLVEAAGGTVKVLSHSSPNFKITTENDLAQARPFFEDGLPFVFGIGFDRHRLVPGRPFYLGGVRIPSPAGPLSHSDGDPLLHALTDGILGAIGAGDIGTHFPDTSPKFRNARSGQFVKEALALAAQKGFMPAQVDSTVILERPKLGAFKEKIVQALSKLLSLPPARISIKAKTSEGLGPEGEGLAVSCQALAVLRSKSSGRA